MSWIKIPGPAGGVCGAQWHYGDTGFYIQHCGHPTASYPYYIVYPNGESYYNEDTNYLATWSHLKDAKKKAEELYELGKEIKEAV